MLLVINIAVYTTLNEFGYHRVHSTSWSTFHVLSYDEKFGGRFEIVGARTDENIPVHFKLLIHE